MTTAIVICVVIFLALAIIGMLPQTAADKVATFLGKGIAYSFIGVIVGLVGWGLLSVAAAMPVWAIVIVVVLLLKN